MAGDGKRSSMRPARIGICPRAPARAIRSAALLSWIPPDLSSIDCCIQADIVAAIEKHATGDVAALARGIIEELRAAGLENRRTDAVIPIHEPEC